MSKVAVPAESLVKARGKAEHPAAVLTIAGSDSGGGAGIQADLKTFMASGTYGLSVITAVTAQNTKEVRSFMAVPPEMIEQQMDAVLEDIDVKAAKTGMLADSSVIKAVVRAWNRHAARAIPLVVDPVMIATTGKALLESDALDTLRNELLPLASVLTPNLREAEAILEMATGSIDDVQKMDDAASLISNRYGVPVVIVKGGHLDSGSVVVDVVYVSASSSTTRVDSRRIDTDSTHGTGCTLSAAIAANLALGMDYLTAAKRGIRYVNEAIQAAYPVGSGNGPVNHGYALRTSPFALPTQHSQHPFTQYLKDSSQGLWQRYIDHPFVQQAADASLSRHSFVHYLKQDYIYLKHYARAWSLAAFKSDSLQEIGVSAQTVLGCVRESSLHVRMCARWGITQADMECERESSTSVAYTRYIIDRGISGDLLELLVAMYPCLLGYGEAAAKYAGDPRTVREGNPYWEWISTYAHADFQSAVEEGRRLIEELSQREMPSGARLARLVKTFNETSALEIEFWDHALQQ
ncbi:trifunctional hydroxymethylpyrimidine kinase/phosphomethylpyrimidine kinase/thiaminase [Coemansia sp. RSA 1722]|nr:trifunctional hydroxymethylpyrimidine kinase/phosphomethylpyrimidine kinase/thiaminase [Coemansia sp. RSA 485]KAJ2598427.1 trifunctional hydroxymethylpyrimidine kinase/phosphomethylpyrimidine kinase/thiaminase [Coemansia sp. RSA 1722]